MGVLVFAVVALAAQAAAGEPVQRAATEPMEPVLVAVLPIARGTAVSAAQFAIERRPLAAGAAARPAAPDAIDGTRLRRSLAAGEVLAAGDLEPVPFVRRGDKVTALAEAAGIAVAMQVTALEDGANGATITVKNDRSGKRLQAVVVAPGTVRVRVENALHGG